MLWGTHIPGLFLYVLVSVCVFATLIFCRCLLCVCVPLPLAASLSFTILHPCPYPFPSSRLPCGLENPMRTCVLNINRSLIENSCINTEPSGRQAGVKSGCAGGNPRRNQKQKLKPNQQPNQLKLQLQCKTFIDLPATRRNYLCTALPRSPYPSPPYFPAEFPISHHHPGQELALVQPPPLPLRAPRVQKVLPTVLISHNYTITKRKVFSTRHAPRPSARSPSTPAHNANCASWK